MTFPSKTFIPAHAISRWTLDATINIYLWLGTSYEFLTGISLAIIKISFKTSMAMFWNELVLVSCPKTWKLLNFKG